MKKTDLQKISNGMATGGNSEAPNGNNLTGAVNTIVRITDEVEKYGLAVSDLTEEQQAELEDAQEDLQYHMDELGSLLGSFTGNDGAVEDDEGNKLLDLPKQASAAEKTADLPSSSTSGS